MFLSAITADCERHGTRCCAAAHDRNSTAKGHLQLYSMVCNGLNLISIHVPSVVTRITLIAAAASLHLMHAAIVWCQQALRSAGALSAAPSTSK